MSLMRISTHNHSTLQRGDRPALVGNAHLGSFEVSIDERGLVIRRVGLPPQVEVHYEDGCVSSNSVGVKEVVLR